MSADLLETYRHSGKFNPPGLILPAIAAAVVGLPLGMAYAYVVRWIPFIYLNLLITLGYGFAFGWLTSRLLRATVLPWSFVRDTPFCERTRSWLDEEKQINTLEHFTDEAHIAALRSGDLMPLTSARPKHEGAAVFTRLLLKRARPDDILHPARPKRERVDRERWQGEGAGRGFHRRPDSPRRDVRPDRPFRGIQTAAGHAPGTGLTRRREPRIPGLPSL
jgi:hypothetical protein